MTPVTTVVGIAADGWDSLAPTAREAVLGAEVLVGGARHLAMLPMVDAELVTWPSPLRERLPALLEEHAGRRVVVLASGDPLVSGVGSTLVDLLGVNAVHVVPTVSSVTLARARMGWSAESVDVVTVVGRDQRVLARHLSPGRRVVVLSSDGSTPALVAAQLVEHSYGASRMSVLSDLGSAEERRLDLPASAWSTREVPRLNVVCIEAWPDRVDVPVLAAVGGLDDGSFEHDGQLTKRDVRASALARLAPVPGQLLWDVGAGAGSVGIEWMRADPRCRAVAVETDPGRAARIHRNAARLGVPALDVRRARAPEGLAGLPAPDAVFVGGGASRPGVLDACWQALRPGGRMVAHAVTLETEQRLMEGYGRHGGELVRLSVEQARPIGTYTGWSPARPVVQWSVTKKEET